MAPVAISNMNSQQALTIGLTIVGVMVAAWFGRAAIGRYRRSLLRGSQEVSGHWSLDDLRDMKDSGQLTEQEYQALRQRMIRKTMDSPTGAKGKANPSGQSER